MLVIPNLLGAVIWSPKLDEIGNSVRGIEFCKELIKAFNFHHYDSLHVGSKKKDPRLHTNQKKSDSAVTLCWAASCGDINQIKQLFARGVDLNSTDYDKRTALHLAASEGEKNVVKYLLSKEVDINPLDRWGATPLDDAYRNGNKEVIALMEKNGARKAPPV